MQVYANPDPDLQPWEGVWFDSYAVRFLSLVLKQLFNLILYTYKEKQLIYIKKGKGI
jgi:hypothetical protein